MTSDQAQATTATVTTPAEREIHIERDLRRAARPRVRGLHRPRADPRVVGPARHDHDRRPRWTSGPAGSWRFVMRDSDGSETAFRGTYREVTAPERIVQTFEWEGMPGHVSVETADVRGPRRSHEGDDDLALPHDRGARRHARLGHGGRHERDLRAPRRAARATRLARPLLLSPRATRRSRATRPRAARARPRAPPARAFSSRRRAWSVALAAMSSCSAASRRSSFSSARSSRCTSLRAARSARSRRRLRGPRVARSRGAASRRLAWRRSSTYWSIPPGRWRIAPSRVERVDVVAHPLDEVAVVADDDERARPGVEQVLERGQGVDVEVVGRLVEQQHVGLAHQQPHELQPAPLAAGQVAHERARLVAAEAEAVAEQRGGDLLAAAQRRAAADLLERLEHAQVAGDLGRVLRQVREPHGRAALDRARRRLRRRRRAR